MSLEKKPAQELFVEFKPSPIQEPPNINFDDELKYCRIEQEIFSNH